MTVWRCVQKRQAVRCFLQGLDANDVDEVFDAAEIVAVAWEQAGPILFLLSDDASNITGSIMATDGGWITY